MKATPAKRTFLALSLGISSIVFAQSGNISMNIAGAPSGNPAILDLSDASNAHLGFLMPNVHLASSTDATTIPTPTSGMIVWNTNVGMPFGVGYYYWSGSVWDFLYSSGAAVVSANNGLAVNTGNNVQLGGNLIQPTTITNNGNTLSLAGSSVTTTYLSSGKVGIGTATPQNNLDVATGMAVGSYAGTNAAPSNGAIISGQTGIGNSSPNASAQLDLTNTSNLGLLPPTVALLATNLAAPVISPANGLTVYNTANTTATAVSMNVAVVPGLYTWDATQNLWVRAGPRCYVSINEGGGLSTANNTYYDLGQFNVAANAGTVTPDDGGISPIPEYVIFTAPTRCKLNYINLQTMSSTASKSVQYQCEKYTVASGATTFPTGTNIITPTSVSWTTAVSYIRTVITGNNSAVLQAGDQVVLSVRNTGGSAFTLYVTGTFEFEPF